MILKYDFLILKKYYIETIRFIINNFIFQIIHSYFAHTTKYKNHIIKKYMKSYFIFTIVLTVAYLVYYAVIIVQDLYGKKGMVSRKKRYLTSVRQKMNRVCT